MSLAGIDYSITGPSMCFQTQDGKYEFHFVTSNKKGITSIKTDWGSFHGYEYPIYKTELERYEKLSQVFLNQILKNDIQYVVFEGYSMGSKGRVFNLAENAGVLKYRIHTYGIGCGELAPTTVKKFAGKGNFDKFQMYDAWKARTGIDLYGLFGISESKSKVPSPIADIVDSYFVLEAAKESY